MPAALEEQAIKLPEGPIISCFSDPWGNLDSFLIFSICGGITFAGTLWLLRISFPPQTAQKPRPLPWPLLLLLPLDLTMILAPMQILDDWRHFRGESAVHVCFMDGSPLWFPLMSSLLGGVAYLLWRPSRRALKKADNFSAYLGKRVLVGVTYETSAGEMLSREEFCGVIQAIRPEDFQINLTRADNGQVYALPFDLDALKPAAPGSYRLRQSGELVVNPDFTTVWTVIKADAEAPETKNNL